METVLCRVVERWRSQNIDLSPPASVEGVAAVWRELGRLLSTDVVALYGAAAGFDNNECDDHDWYFWALDDLTKRNRGYNSTGVLFADFGINAWVYSFRYEELSRSSVWYDPLFDDGAEEIAPSVEEFFRLYLDDPKSIMLS